MRIRTATTVLALAAVFLAPAALPRAAGAAGPGALELGGWIPYWRTATGTADVLPHLSALTEISPFVFTVNNDGTLADMGGMEREPWTSFIAAAQKEQVRVIPTILWNDAAAMQTILSDSSARIALEDRVADLVRQNGYDGIDIDFEGKRAETEPYFSTFLKGLYARMGPKWVYCTIEPRTPLSALYGGTSPADAPVYANDYTVINRYCDRVEIMAYDQGDIDAILDQARAGPYIPIADPAWVEKVVDLAAQTISKKKIIIGIPTYGYEYTTTPLAHDTYHYNLRWAFDPDYARALSARLGITPVRTASGELSFIYTPSGSNTTARQISNGTFAGPGAALYSQALLASQYTTPFDIVWWSDAEAVADKVQLAQKLGVRGVTLFKFDGGEDPRIWDILP